MYVQSSLTGSNASRSHELQPAVGCLLSAGVVAFGPRYRANLACCLTAGVERLCSDLDLSPEDRKVRCRRANSGFGGGRGSVSVAQPAFGWASGLVPMFMRCNHRLCRRCCCWRGRWAPSGWASSAEKSSAEVPPMHHACACSLWSDLVAMRLSGLSLVQRSTGVIYVAVHSVVLLLHHL